MMDNAYKKRTIGPGTKQNNTNHWVMFICNCTRQLISSMTELDVVEIDPIEWLERVVNWIAFTYGTGDNAEENANNIRKKDARNNHLRAVQLVASSRAFPQADLLTGGTPRLANFAPSIHEMHEQLIQDIPNFATFKRKYLEHKHFDVPRKYVKLHRGRCCDQYPTCYPELHVFMAMETCGARPGEVCDNGGAKLRNKWGRLMRHGFITARCILPSLRKWRKGRAISGPIPYTVSYYSTLSLFPHMRCIRKPTRESPNSYGRNVKYLTYSYYTDTTPTLPLACDNGSTISTPFPRKVISRYYHVEMVAFYHGELGNS
jgi:hypothetical protein